MILQSSKVSVFAICNVMHGSGDEAINGPAHIFFQSTLSSYQVDSTASEMFASVCASFSVPSPV